MIQGFKNKFRVDFKGKMLNQIVIQKEQLKKENSKSHYLNKPYQIDYLNYNKKVQFF